MSWQVSYTLVLLIVSVLFNLVLAAIILLRHRRVSDRIDKYLLVLNLLDQRITEYQRLYVIYKIKLDKKYQVNRPVAYSRQAYSDELQKYVNTLVKQLLSEFSRDSRAVLLELFSEEGLIRYVIDKITR